VLATLGGAAALAWSVRGLTGRWSFGWLAGGLFITQNLTVLLWGSLHRVDALALGLALAGLALATRGRPAAAGIFLLLAFFTKQTYLVAPVVAAVYLWPSRAEFGRFCLVVLGGGLLGIATAQWLTDGWFVWHTIVANSNEPDLATFATLTGSFLQFNGISVLTALAAFALPSARGERVWRLYLVGTLLTLPTIAKLGASSNYWLELSAATAALLAIASWRLTAWPLARLVAPTVIAGSLFVAVPAYQATAVEAALNFRDLAGTGSPRYVSLVSDRGSDPYRVDARFIEQIAREPGDVLTDNSGLAVAAGKRVAYEFQIFQLLNVEGRWAERPILDAIAARRFSLVAVMHPLDGPAEGTRWTASLRSALLAAYRPAGAQAGFWLYRPPGSAVAEQPAGVEPAGFRRPDEAEALAGQ
jgi:hypothetical protein